ncbi:Formin-like protein 8 [Morella rubra]|uniref:Formin-like protein 8 n=1 Tax=Morella rubra TaxID=262757 RepID=A0A6A1VWZ1_9ROSI|nr:Formin-like protein 8 [Morella rubra]
MLPPSPSPSPNNTVVKVVAATAATTLVIAGIFLFFFQKLVIARRQKQNKVNRSFQRQEGALTLEELKNFGGNVKGLIVDENGLDVLYLTKLEGGQLRASFPKFLFNPNFKDKTERRVDVTLEEPRKSKPREVPLLSLPLRPPLPQLSEPHQLQMILERETQVPPPASSPLQSKKFPLPPPPPKPFIPAKQSPALPPPTPKAGSPLSSLKPLPVPRAKASSKGWAEASAGESSRGLVSGQMKLKPLLWDKVIAHADHSMVWDTIVDGSFRFEDDLMETLFGYVNSKCKSFERDYIMSTSSKDALFEGQGLNADTLEKITKMAPTQEEEAKILVVEQVVRSEGTRCLINQNHCLDRSKSQIISTTGTDSLTAEERDKEYLTLGLLVLECLSIDLSKVKKSASIEYDIFANICSTLGVRITEIRQLMRCCGNDEMSGFMKEMKGFLEECEEELKVVRQEQTRVMDLVQSTT